jgi:5-methylcytosine-specific restriction endonuclease McrA
MRDYSLAHLSDQALLLDLAKLVARDRTQAAILLAHIAEVDSRRLYVQAGHPSMFAYCVDELGLSEDAASKRIQAARSARQFPALFGALSEGRLHLTAICLLAPYLTPENVHVLMEEASHRRKAEIQELLARRFPHREAPAVVRAIAAAPSELSQHAPAHVGSPLFEEHAPAHVAGESSLPAGALEEHAPAHVGDASLEEATSPERFLIQLTVSKSTHEKLRHAQALLSHAIPTGNVAQVLDRALDTLIVALEKQKLGAKTSPQRHSHPSARRRYVPAQVRRAVWERDQGQCTFAAPSGKRCTARKFLEFDHVEPVALGGGTSVEGLRLRCRAHNQYEAERIFGSAFMRRKRDEARRARAEQMKAKERVQDVLAGLRGLGCRADEARRAAEFSETLQGASLEERMRAALQFLGSKGMSGRSPSENLHRSG